MKKLYTLLLTLTAALAARAQVSITQADMPVAGDTLRYSISAPAGVAVPTQTGQGLTWDYSSLVPVAQGVDAYRSALSINPAYFLFALQGWYGYKIADTIDLGPAQVYDIYDFYKRNAQAFTAEGRAATFQQIPLSSTYTDPDEVYSFPLVYGDRDSTTFRVAFSVAGQGTVIQRGSRVNQVLGEGQLMTPYGTYAALLVRVDVRETDSIITPIFPLPPIPRNTTTLVWLAQGQHRPLLELDLTRNLAGAVTVTGVRYRDIYRQLAPIVPLPAFEAVQTELNTGDTTLFINLTQAGFSTAFQWDITPPTGWAYVTGTSNRSRNPIVQFTSPGFYNVSLRATTSGVSADTLRPNYIHVSDATATRGAIAGAALHLYPNPAHAYAELDLPTQDAARTWVWTDATGRQIPAQAAVVGGKTRFNTSLLAPGLYQLSTPPRSGDRGYHLRVTIAR